MKKFIFLLLIVLCTLLTENCICQWQPDVRLTNDPANTSLCPNNAWCIASNGDIVHVLFCDLRNGSGNWEIYYKRSTDAGVNWGADTRLTNNSAESWDPSVSVTGSAVHIVWIDNRDGNYEIYYKRSTDGGVSWGTDTRLTNFTGTSMRPSISSSGSVVHIVWHDNRDGNDEIYYKCSTDGGTSWGTDTRLTNNSASSTVPSLAVSGQNVHVVWQENRDGNLEIYYNRSTDGGVSWGTDTRLTNNSDTSMSPSISVSSSTVHVVWHDTRNGNYEIYYKRSTDGGISWQADTRLTNNSAQSYLPSLSVSGSVVHIVWMDDRDGNFEIYYNRSLNSGVSWGLDTTRLTTYAGNSIYSSVSVSGSVVHVAWMDYRAGTYPDIYYKRNPTGNPAAIKANLNSIYRPNDSRTQTYNITLSDSLCTGQIDSVYWYINDSLVGRQHTMTYPYKQGTSKVKLIIKQNPSTYDSTTANVTRTCWKRYKNGPVQAGLSYIGDNYLYTIATGDKVYRMDIYGNDICNMTAQGNILSSCSIACDTFIYLATDQYNLYSFNKNCAPNWGPIGLGSVLMCTPTFDNITNRIYLGTTGNVFLGINRTNGSTNWSSTLSSSVVASSVISKERKLFVPTSNGTLYGFNLNLTNPSPPTWQISTYDSILASPAIDTSGYFYVGSRSGKIYKIFFQTSPPNSSIVWTSPSLGSAVTSSLVIDAYGNLYAGTANGRLYSIKTNNGSVKWFFQTDSTIKSTPAITTYGRIYFGNNKGEIFGLDTAKNVKFYYIDSSKITCAMLHKDGTLYFGNEAGRVFAIYDTTGGTKGPVQPSWGTFQNNPQRTGGENPCGLMGIQNCIEEIPDKFALFQNYPNPFNPNTSIKFSIAKKADVKLVIFDILGRDITTLVNDKLQPGVYIVDWNVFEYASGVYFYKLETNYFTDTKKMLLIK
jgi:hypothetical protein